MGKRVILELEGDFLSSGFRATLAIRTEQHGTVLTTKASLPPAPELAQHLQHHWQDTYRSLASHPLGMAQRIKAQKIIHKGSLNRRMAECRASARELGDRLQHWLNSDSFQPIDRRLREELSRDDTIQFLLSTDHPDLPRLPWQEWDFFDRYPYAELALSTSDYEALRPHPGSPATRSSRHPVRILAILGHQQGLNLEADRQALSALPQAEVEFLVEPTRQHVSDRLWEQPWDILFFAGHSETQGETGRIYINATDSLSLSELKHSLRRAIAHGLHLAIFNSCDGLGLAYELRQLHIPQLIVMREPVVDQVAAVFLRYFLEAFAAGESFYLAARHARERLQGLEDRFPCASWLPIIYQHPLAVSPHWASLTGKVPDQHTDQPIDSDANKLPNPDTYLSTNPRHDDRAIAPLSTPTSTSPSAAIPNGSASGAAPPTSPPEPPQTPPQAPVPNPPKASGWYGILPIAGVAALGTMLVRLTGLLQPLELAAYDQLMRSRPPEAIDDRILVVEVTEADVNQYGGYPLADQVVAEAIATLQTHQPQAIALDIHRAQPRGSGREALIDQLQAPNVVSVCAFGTTDQSYGPPPELATDIVQMQMGFSNLLTDEMQGNTLVSRPDVQSATQTRGQTVRRQLLSYAPTLAQSPSACVTPYSLSLQLAFYQFLANDVEPITVTDDQHWQFGDTIFPRLPRQFGGYQHLDGLSSQVMVNYRTSSPGQATTLNQVMADTLDPALVRDRLVLIGYTAPVARDAFTTPYGDMAGVWVHAHMVSHLLSAVGTPGQNNTQRSLIWVLPQWGAVQWGDGLWVLAWSLAGGLLIWELRSRPRTLRWMGGVGLLIPLYLACWLLMNRGGWMPLIPAGLSVLVTVGGVVVYVDRT